MGLVQFMNWIDMLSRPLGQLNYLSGFESVLEQDAKLLTPAWRRTGQNSKWPPVGHLGSDFYQFQTNPSFIDYKHYVKI